MPLRLLQYTVFTHPVFPSHTHLCMCNSPWSMAWRQHTCLRSCYYSQCTHIQRSPHILTYTRVIHPEVWHHIGTHPSKAATVHSIHTSSVPLTWRLQQGNGLQRGAVLSDPVSECGVCTCPGVIPSIQHWLQPQAVVLRTSKLQGTIGTGAENHLQVPVVFWVTL